MNLEDVQKLIQIVEKSKLGRFKLKRGDFELILEKESKCPPLANHIPHPHSTYHPHSVAPGHEKEVNSEEKHSGSFIKSPMVGTYYTSAGPDQPVFVKVGDRVEEDQVVCIIEAMKVMNEVKAGKNGVIKEIFCKNAQPVEFGSKLFRIE